MALDRQEAQKILNKHKLDGQAVGGFLARKLRDTPALGPGMTILFAMPAGTTPNHLIIVTSNLGLAVAKTIPATKRVLRWQVRPEHEIRFELDPLEVRKGEDAVEFKIGRHTFGAFGPERDAAFRLFAHQPKRWPDSTDTPGWKR
jgi:hypothetical protein